MKHSTSIKNLERHAVALLTYRGPLTCTELGEALWGTESRLPQSYARPAGRVLHRLKRKGAVRELIGTPSKWQVIAAAYRPLNG